jgi:hypothetical protein
MPSRRPRLSARELEKVLEVVRAWGSQGGQERAKRLTPERRREIATKAVMARWAKAKGTADGEKSRTRGRRGSR